MIRIAIVDDEPKQLSRGERLITEVFQKLELTPDVQPYPLDMTIALDKASRIVEDDLIKYRPHVVICDNKVGLDEAWGQTFLARLKRTLPESVMCLMTRESLRSNHFGLRTPNPDLIIHKGHLGGDETYQRYVAERLVALLTSAENISIEWATPFEEMFASIRDSRHRRPTIEDVASLLEQCLFDRDLKRERKSIKVERLPGGRSGSVVMSCRLSGNLSYGVTGVVKVSRREDALREFENYNAFVKWVLPYTWRVEVLGTGHTEGMGAICYSFAFDGEGQPRACVELLRVSDPDITGTICDSIFNPKSKAWYSQIRRTGKDASQYFQGPRFFSRPSQIQEREAKLVVKMKELFGDAFEDTDEKLRLFGEVVKRPSRLLFTEDWGEVEECVCHGDLNANNILISPKGGGLAFIDFQNTGYHNIFRDFVSYEGSVRIDWGGVVEASDLSALLQSEVELARGKGAVGSGYEEQVRRVRTAAVDNFPPDAKGERPMLYLLAAYVHFSWLLARFDDWTRDGSTRLALGAFAALVVLDEVAGVSAAPPV